VYEVVRISNTHSHSPNVCAFISLSSFRAHLVQLHWTKWKKKKRVQLGTWETTGSKSGMPLSKKTQRPFGGGCKKVRVGGGSVLVCECVSACECVCTCFAVYTQLRPHLTTLSYHYTTTHYTTLQHHIALHCNTTLHFNTISQPVPSRTAAKRAKRALKATANRDAPQEDEKLTLWSRPLLTLQVCVCV
jgi:hypothetical protein